ncbi:MAG: cytochrome c3 family protein [Candidatus Eisenbacteria bacterium]|uniref:Cytochrome c3 family protein n=1 Tax=Eiseniibacteriota bacterium TaxID=2212470 RepID=A0A933WB72_UNCEI|nr:cytochrome c3 family protein [Candidatus Eisenbacteria bacterium]
MKHSIRIAAAAGVAVLLVLAVPVVRAQAPGAWPNGTSVVETLHNLSYAASSDRYGPGALRNYGEVCVYCHTPHGGQTSAPLWNRNFSVASYQMYDSGHSSTINMTVDSQPTGVSLACLSCHDGTVGLDVIVNTPNSYTGGAAVGTHMPSNILPNLGTDLRNDHPVSVTYDPTADTYFRSAASVHAAGLQLYGGKVQCGSCHNPHTAANRPFLRISNAGSSLCLTCHIK